MGVCRSVLQILTLFQTKTCHFPHPFSDLTSKIHTRFQTWPFGEIMLSLPRSKAQTKNSSNPFQIRSLLFLYSFGIKTINTFIYSRSSLQKSYPIPDQNGQRVYQSADQNDAKTLPEGAVHTYIAYIKGYPPGSDNAFLAFSLVHSISVISSFILVSPLIYGKRLC